jgi:hypothetical protein
MEQTSLVYKLMALWLLVDHFNFLNERLGLGLQQIESPQSQYIQEAAVDPAISFDGQRRHLEGLIRTREFHLGLSGGMIVVTRIKNGIEDWQDESPRVARSERIQPIRLAKGWLANVGVDVSALEEECSPWVERYKAPLAESRSYGERCVVSWFPRGIHRDKKAAVKIQLNPTSQKFVSLYIRDRRFAPVPPDVPHAIGVSRLPDEPIRLDVQKPYPSYSNLVAMVTMDQEEDRRQNLLREAKSVLEALSWDAQSLMETNLLDVYVTPRAFGRGGDIQLKNGEVHFGAEGYLEIFDLLPPGQTNKFVWASIAEATIDTNRAFQIATQRLAAISIDVARLSVDHDAHIVQDRVVYRKGLGRVRALSPEIHVFWGGSRYNWLKDAVAWVRVYGDSELVGDLRIRDPRYFKTYSRGVLKE